MDQFKYDIGDKKYTQRPLVFGQWQLLAKLLTGKPMPATFDAPGVIAAFGPDIHRALAIALIPEGGSAQDKADPQALAVMEENLLWNIELPTMLQAVEDFFELSQLSSLFDQLTETLQRVAKMIRTAEQAQKLTSTK